MRVGRRGRGIPVWVPVMLAAALGAWGVSSGVGGEERGAVLEFTQARLLVDDLGRARVFYTEVVGLEVGFENPVYVELRSSTGASIGLYPRRAMAEAIGDAPVAESPGGADRGVLVFRVADVDAVAATLRERGARQVAAPTDRVDWGLRTAHFRDPEGNLIELIRRLEAP